MSNTTPTQLRFDPSAGFTVRADFEGDGLSSDLEPLLLVQEITEYIEIFYNRQRKQKRLGYLSPAAFTQKYYDNLLAA